MEYLGYLLSPDGLTMSNKKVQAIIDWPEPQKVKDPIFPWIRKFLSSIHL